MYRLATILLIGGLAAQSTDAGPIGLGDFSGGETLIDFETIASDEAITTQFSSLGITFDPGLYGDPSPSTGIQGTMEATNYDSSVVMQNPIIATFDSPQVRVGFYAAGSVSGNSSILLRAYLGAALVDEFTFITGEILPGGDLPSVFAGLEVAGGMDYFEVSRPDGNGAFSMDDLRFEIPEPTMLSLLVLGGLFVAERRR